MTMEANVTRREAQEPHPLQKQENASTTTITECAMCVCVLPVSSSHEMVYKYDIEFAAQQQTMQTNARTRKLAAVGGIAMGGDVK